MDSKLVEKLYIAREIWMIFEIKKSSKTVEEIFNGFFRNFWENGIVLE